MFSETDDVYDVVVWSGGEGFRSRDLDFSFFRTAWLSARAESQVDFRWKKLLELPIPFKEREERLGIGLVACLSS